MISLANFPNPPPKNCQTICERNSCFIQRPNDFKEVSEDIVYPAFYGILEKGREVHNRELQDSSPFVQTHEPARVKLLKAWRSGGWAGVLIQLASLNNQPSNPWAKPAWISVFIDYCTKLRFAKGTVGSQMAQVQNWDTSHIRHMAWHPHTEKLAVALQDDQLLVKLYSCSNSCSDVTPLKLPRQKQIVQLAWRPFSASDLAVACSSCIVIWNVQPLAGNSRSPITSTNQVLSKEGHCPISSIAWTPVGDLLVSCSPMDRCILVWNTNMEEHQAIRCTTSPLFSSFSPDHLKLLTTSPSNSFHVWECKGWSNVAWGGMEGVCGAHAWSPDGNTLLFSPSLQPIIYSLVFLSPKVASNSLTVTRTPTAVISLAEMEGREGERVGGVVHQIAWDPNGERLVVSFRGSSSELIAVYQTSFKPFFKALPRGFIRGMASETVAMLSFKPSFPAGSLLSVAWSSGRISHIPFYYKAGLVIGQIDSRDLDLSINDRPTMEQLLTFDGNQSLSYANASGGVDNDSLFYRHRSSNNGVSRMDDSSGGWCN